MERRDAIEDKPLWPDGRAGLECAPNQMVLRGVVEVGYEACVRLKRRAMRRLLQARLQEVGDAIMAAWERNREDEDEA